MHGRPTDAALDCVDDFCAWLEKTEKKFEDPKLKRKIEEKYNFDYTRDSVDYCQRLKLDKQKIDP